VHNDVMCYVRAQCQQYQMGSGHRTPIISARETDQCNGDMEECLYHKLVDGHLLYASRMY